MLVCAGREGSNNTPGGNFFIPSYTIKSFSAADGTYIQQIPQSSVWMVSVRLL